MDVEHQVMGDLFIPSLQELAWEHSSRDMTLGIMISITLHAQMFHKLESYHGLLLSVPDATQHHLEYSKKSMIPG